MNRLPKKFVERVAANLKKYQRTAETQQKANWAWADTVTFAKEIWNTGGRMRQLVKWILITVFSAMPFAASSQVNELTLATSFREGSDLRNSIEKIVGDFNNEMKGRSVINIVYSDVKEINVFSSKFDLIFVPVSIFSEKIPDVKVFSIPFLFQDYYHLGYFENTIGNYIISSLYDNNVVGIEFINGPMSFLVTRDKRNYSQIESIKVAVSSAETFLSVGNFGGDPIFSDPNSINSMLKESKVDGVSLELDYIEEANIAPSLTPYIFPRPQTPSVALLAARKEIWKSLPIEMIAKLKEASEFQSSAQNDAFQKRSDVEQGDLVKRGYFFQGPPAANFEELPGLWTKAWDVKDVRVVEAGSLLAIAYERERKLPQGQQILVGLDLPLEMEVFFATDRRDDNHRHPKYAFANSRGREISYGFSEVRFTDHSSYKLNAIASAVKLETSKFLDRFRTSLMGKDNQVDIYIHGFNTLFFEAIEQYTGLHRDLGLDGVPVVFSWPSDGFALGYLSDAEEIRNSEQNFAQFLDLISSEFPNIEVNIIAHSMGSRLVLESIQSSNIAGRSKIKINNIALAAPDVTIYRFEQMKLLPTNHFTQITMYGSEYDSALKCSKFVNGSVRLGEGGEYVSVYEGMTTIDASRIEYVPGLWSKIINSFGICEHGHSYVTENKRVMDDISAMINAGIPVDRRSGLDVRRKNGIDYWVMTE